MEKLTTGAIEIIKKDHDCFIEVTKAWGRNRNSIYRWILENRRPELTHPRTIRILEKYNKENIALVETN